MYLRQFDVFVPLPSMNAADEIPPGIYNITQVELNGGKAYGLRSITNSVRSEPIIPINHDVFHLVLDYAESFRAKEADYDNMGFSHRTGIFLYGSEGTGKSVLSKTIALKLIDNGYIIIYLRDMDDLKVCPNIIRWVRHTEHMKDQRFCIIMDEFEAYVTKDETSVLKFLDGDDSQSGVLTIAITNYKSLIPSRVLRPTRFGLIREIPRLSPDVIREYVKAKLRGVVDDQLMFKFLAELDEISIPLSIDVVKDFIVKKFILGERFSHSDFDLDKHKVVR